ncbi:hypothetical protein HHK36_024065 [Tetracentron sinense]|uniref:Cytochrome P450 n=1 Tax=Tetracentron sinense TaxID=13715 RepID=A0A834YIC8_TETSI|nr:hypothetical protein HHK36_024065 [Tetracentron sinense]
MRIMAVPGEINLLFPVLLLLPILFLIFKHFRPLSPLKCPPLPPGPYPWPLIGNILDMGKMPHVSLSRLAQAYGPLISLKLGSQFLVVGSSPAAATEILKTHDRILSARHIPHVIPAKSPDLNNLSLGWAIECNDQWKYLRTICRAELFSAKAIESQASLREKKVMEMVGFMGTKEGKVVEVGEVVFATVFNMLTNALLLKDFINLEDERVGGGMKGLVRRISEVASAPNLDDFYPILGGLDLQNLKKEMMEVFRRIYSLWGIIIKERRERKDEQLSSQRCFMDVLIDNAFSDDQINQLLLELLAAGTDTSTSTIEWAMSELINNQEPMNKVRVELAREIDQNVVTESNLPQLPYLHACVKETLRLHPPAPLLIPHRAAESCKVMNYTIPKDTQVFVNVWAIGRDPMIWEDPLTFKPERFLSSDLDFKGNNFEFLPFGAGRRICPGLPMATKQVHLILASLIHFFDWYLPPDMDTNKLDMNEKFGVTLQKEQPLLLIPKVRKQSRD